MVTQHPHLRPWPVVCLTWIGRVCLCKRWILNSVCFTWNLDKTFAWIVILGHWDIVLKEVIQLGVLLVSWGLLDSSWLCLERLHREVLLVGSTLGVNVLAVGRRVRLLNCLLLFRVHLSVITLRHYLLLSHKESIHLLAFAGLGCFLLLQKAVISYCGVWISVSSSWTGLLDWSRWSLREVVLHAVAMQRLLSYDLRVVNSGGLAEVLLLLSACIIRALLLLA